MFDRTKEYEGTVKPLFDQIEQICRIYGIPCFCTCCVKDDIEKSEYRRTLVSPTSLGIKLTDDQFHNHINVCNGFVTVPVRTSDTFEAFDSLEDDLED